MSLEKAPPSNIEAEMSLLGACQQSSVALDEAAERLTADAFYDPAHRLIFATMIQLYEKNSPVDPVTVANALDAAGKLDAVGGSVYLAKLDDSVPTTAHSSAYIQTVEGKWILRELIRRTYEVQQSSYDSPDDPFDILDRAEASLFELALRTKTETYKTAAAVAKIVERRIEAAASGEQKVGGLSWGFAELDERTNGLLNGDFAIIGARPSMGKTSLLLNIAMNLSVDQGVPVALFSLETTAEQLLTRCLSARLGISALDLGRGKVADWQKFTGELGRLSDAPLYISDSPFFSPLRLRSIARRLCATRGVRLIGLDYLQLLRSGDRRYENRNQELSEICGILKGLARELNIPVIVLSQLNRDVEDRADKRPILSDLRESGAIEQDADIVVFLMRPEHYNPQNSPGIAKVWLAKNRNGPLGAFELGFQAHCTKFTPLSRQGDKEDYGRGKENDTGGNDPF